MATNSHTPFGVLLPSLPSLPYVNQELKRIPSRTRVRLILLGLGEDLSQELHLAYLQSQAQGNDQMATRRAIHAAGERFRYHEIVRRAKYEVPEELAGTAYHRLVYGTEPEQENAAE
jgi:hypothetical protein